MKAICDFISRWMGVLVLLMAVFSFLVPAPIGAIPTWVINPLLGLIMFGMGLTLSAKDFRIVFSRPKDVLIGCLAQFTVMPFMAWLLAWVFDLPKELALGVILVGCCPGGTASNVITFLARGDLGMAVGRNDGGGGYRGDAAEHSLCGDRTDYRRTALSALPSADNPQGCALSACLLHTDDYHGGGHRCLAHGRQTHGGRNDCDSGCDTP